MDIIPTSHLLQCYDSFSEIIAQFANLSFTDGKFPSRVKTASVTRQLQTKYSYISNLNFISKILEGLFSQRIQPYILASLIITNINLLIHCVSEKRANFKTV